MASVDCDVKGILMSDCLPKEQTINGEYNIKFIDQLCQNNNQKRFLHDREIQYYTE